jgi:hypothetical protein
VNWLTIAFAVVFFWSVFRGCVRRFAPEAGYLAAQATHLVAAVVALACAWFASVKISGFFAHVKAGQIPAWATELWRIWQQSPQLSHLALLLVLYFVVSAVLHRVVHPIPGWVVRVIPRGVGGSRLFGGVLGALAGAVCSVALGAVVFLVLQFVSVPSLQMLATNSQPYIVMNRSIFQPWLKPLVARELPVLTANALEPLSKNISLFAVPTSTDGTQVGVLVVPKDIATLAQRITAGQTSSRAKAYALYEWEIHHIKYDWNKYYDYVNDRRWDQQSPLDTLRTGKGVCADYALLYAEMAHAVGITVEIDEGIGGTALDYGPHAWNRVWDDRQQVWIPVDTTWGAEQDEWFNPPNFDATHHVQTRIRIEGAAH